MKRIICLIWLASVLLAPPLYAGDTAEGRNARDLFNKGLKGDNAALDQAIEQFESLLKISPGHPVYRAYLGACKTVQGGNAWMPWNKMRLTEQGLDDIDKALESLKPGSEIPNTRGVPARLEALLVAGNTFINIPDSIFHRRSKGMRLIRAIMADPAYAKTPVSFREAVREALKN